MKTLAAIMVWGAALCGAMIAPAFAEIIPPAVQPGVIDRGLQAQSREAPDNAPVAIPAMPEAPAPAADIRFALASVEVTGSSVFSAATLQSAYAGLVGRQVSLGELYAATNAVTARYAAAGYALSFAVAPAQRIKDGHVQIVVVEGYIADVRIEGGKRVPKVLAAYGERLKRSRPIRTAVLERYLLLANKLAGASVHAVFDPMPGAPKGATRLILKFQQKSADASVTLDNRGSRAFGPTRLDTQVSFNSVLGAGEQFRLRLLTALPTRDMTYAAGALDLPLNDDGLSLKGSLSYSRAAPGLPDLRAVDFHSSGWIGALALSDSLIDTRAQSLVLSAGVTAKRLSGDLGSMPNSRDRIFVLNAAGAYLSSDPWGRTFVNLEGRQGVGLMNATREGDPLVSRLHGDAEYSALLLDAMRLQTLSDNLDLLLSFSGQISSRALLAPEQCGYGGATFGRGFDDSELQGDLCAMGSAELRYTPHWKPGPSVTLLQFYTFADGGAVQQRGALLYGEQRSQDAVSAGVGVRFGLASGLSGSLEFAQPFLRDVSQQGNRDGRIFAAISWAR